MQNFLMDCRHYTFESITAIALDTRVGCMDANPHPEAEKNIDAINYLVENFPQLLYGFPWWKFMPKRWNKFYRTCEDNHNIAADFIKAMIDAAIKRLEGQKEHLDSLNEVSILEKMIIKNGPNSPITYVMAFDMVFAGIDTTGNKLAFLVSHLSKNPDKQEILRQEILSFGRSNLTVQDVGKMPYFKACLQESFRLTPIANALGRILPEDSVIGEYKVPAGKWLHIKVNHPFILFITHLILSNFAYFFFNNWINKDCFE